MAFTKKRVFKKKAVKRPYKKKAVKKMPIYRNVSSNVLTIKCRVPFELKYSDFNLRPDNSIAFDFVNAPWRNLSVTTNNRLYNSDFVAVLPLYQQYRLAKVEYCLRRPKQFLNQQTGGDIITSPLESMGTEILHSRMVMAADATTNVVQGTANLQPRMILQEPVTWKEAVDNQSSRFHIHGYKTFVKRTWLPGTPFEKLWRNRDTSVDQDHACGGLHICIKNKAIIPELTALVPTSAQVMVEGYADVYVNYCRRT